MSETSSYSLVKDQKVDLTKTNPGLSKIALGLGWDTNAGNGPAYDLDAFAVIQDSNDKGKELVYFNNKKSADLAIEHGGDNLTGEGSGDDETLKINLSLVSTDVNRISVGANIYKANERGNQNFGMVKNAFIRVYNLETGEEILKYDLSEDSSSANGMVFGSLYRHSGEWKFESNSQVRNGDVLQIFNSFN